MKAWVAAALAVIGAGLAGAAQAEVADRSATGFTLVQRVEIATPAARVWPILLKPALWWNPSHSWTGDAKNLAIDLDRRCFCETLPGGGFAQHMAVIYADGRANLRMSGALGPLSFTGATGNMQFALKEQGGRTAVTLTYSVGGYAKGGLAETWAAPVDGVLAEQIARLKAAVETP